MSKYAQADRESIVDVDMYPYVFCWLSGEAVHT